MFPSIPLLSVVSQPFKRSQLGLFHGKTKQYGNNVPFSKHKTRRTWLPNVQRKRLFSETLKEDIRVKLTTRALRSIKKHGGLDNYVERTRPEILGWEGMRIRLKIREHQQVTKEKTSPIEMARRRAHKELAAITKSKPTTAMAEQQRDMVMEALKLSSRPTAKQTIEFLEERRKNLVKALYA